MKILIITVGNRQIGWRCQDEIVRCLGVSGNSRDESPDHVTELYKEIGVEKPKNRYFVRHLGQLLYEECERSGDYGAVELLLDLKIIEAEVANGLEEIWLIGTDQPSPQVTEEFRSGDTVWLSKLMAGKIRQVWGSLEVKTWDLKVDASNIEAIRGEYEQFVLRHLIEKSNDVDAVTLLIENKGSVPAIASSLEICAAALVRQFEVVRVVPKEPSPMYVGENPQQMSAVFAETFRQQSMSQYFFPLEKSRIISAWERGDFGEAKAWLQGHQNRYSALYKLAGYLEDATRQDIKTLLQEIKGQWLPTKKLKQVASMEQIQVWSGYDCLDKTKTAAIIWECAFQIPIDARVGRLSSAFFLMAQTLERLLYQVYKKDRWLDKEWIVIPESLKEKGIGKDAFNPRLEELIRVWTEQYGAKSRFEMLDGIREKRNKIVHEAAGVSLDEIKCLWSKANLDIVPIGEALLIPLQEVSKRAGNLPEKPLLLSLHEWGLDVLRS
jgi:hypothetical protein